MNLLMIAPMYDNKGGVRYFLGCQIDVSPLIEGGRGLDSFSRLLSQDRSESRFESVPDRDPINLIGELGQMLNEPEVDFVMNRIGGGSSHGSGRSTPQPSRRPTNRRFFSMDESGNSRSGGSMKALWPDASLGHSGRLPGVYRNVSVLLRTCVSKLTRRSIFLFALIPPSASLSLHLLFEYQDSCKAN